MTEQTKPTNMHTTITPSRLREILNLRTHFTSPSHDEAYRVTYEPKTLIIEAYVGDKRTMYVEIPNCQVCAKYAIEFNEGTQTVFIIDKHADIAVMELKTIS